MSDLMGSWEQRPYPLSEEPIVRVVHRLMGPVVRQLESRIHALEGRIHTMELEMLMLRCRHLVECGRAGEGRKSTTHE